MIGPSATLFTLAGAPIQEGVADAPGLRCRVCGAECTRAMLYRSWQGASFTDQNKLRDWSSQHICEPCVWAHAGPTFYWEGPDLVLPADRALDAVRRLGVHRDARTRLPPSVRRHGRGRHRPRASARVRAAGRARVRAWSARAAQTLRASSVGQHRWRVSGAEKRVVTDEPRKLRQSQDLSVRCGLVHAQASVSPSGKVLVMRAATVESVGALLTGRPQGTACTSGTSVSAAIATASRARTTRKRGSVHARCPPDSRPRPQSLCSLVTG